jgi:hypothetical protein
VILRQEVVVDHWRKKLSDTTRRLLRRDCCLQQQAGGGGKGQEFVAIRDPDGHNSMDFYTSGIVLNPL